MRLLPHVLSARPLADDAPRADKENTNNRGPVYFSLKPGGAGPSLPGAGQAPMQGSRFRGSAPLTPLDPGAPGAALMNAGHTVEPLTPRKVGYFCPEINFKSEAADAAIRIHDSQMSSSGLCEELKELSAILDSDASVPASVPGRLHSAGNFSRTASSADNGMRLRVNDLIFQERIGETGGQGGEVYSALYRDPETNGEHRVAVKRFPSAATSEQIQSLRREVLF